MLMTQRKKISLNNFNEYLAKKIFCLITRSQKETSRYKLSLLKYVNKI